MAQAREAWRIDRMHRIYFEIHCCGRPTTRLDHIEIGRLLGYSEDDIGVFLRHIACVNGGWIAIRRRAA